VKILVADDDPVWLRMIEAMVRTWGDEVIAVTDGQRAWEVLGSPERPPLAILDWSMPGVDGIEICRRLRADTVRSYVYVLLLTVRDKKDDLLQAFDAGADDFLKKPFDPDELRARLRAAGRVMDLQAALLGAQAELRIKAMHDAMTGLLNRGAILEVLERELSRARRENTTVGITLVDVDHFKQVNDVHGHAAGDVVLQEVSRRMTGVVRPYDTVGRYGGEEFLVVLPGTDEATVRGIAERIRHGIEVQPFATSDKALPVTASLGIAAHDPLGAVDADALIRAADAALYRAKRGGRNRCETATAEDLTAR
jgi:diguanylate cyclase (GGDEF)-like protein